MAWYDGELYQVTATILQKYQIKLVELLARVLVRDVLIENNIFTIS